MCRSPSSSSPFFPSVCIYLCVILPPSLSAPIFLSIYLTIFEAFSLPSPIFPSVCICVAFSLSLCPHLSFHLSILSVFVAFSLPSPIFLSIFWFSLSSEGLVRDPGTVPTKVNRFRSDSSDRTSCRLPGT